MLVLVVAVAGATAAPLPNASFDTAPALLDAEVGVHQGVDDGPISTVEVFVDAVFKDEFAVVYRVEQKKVRAITELVKYIKKVFS